MCSTCGGISGGRGYEAMVYTPRPTAPQAGDCDITSEMLNTWMSIVLCLKNSSTGDIAGLSEFAINQLTGTIQSAINYPDNYCYFSVELNKFRDIDLIKIIENVPECNI